MYRGLLHRESAVEMAPRRPDVIQPRTFAGATRYRRAISRTVWPVGGSDGGVSPIVVTLRVGSLAVSVGLQPVE